MPYRLRLGWRRAPREGSERPKIYFQPYPTPLRHFLSCVALIPTRHSGREQFRLALNEVFLPNCAGHTHDHDSNVAGIHQALSAHYPDALRLR